VARPNSLPKAAQADVEKYNTDYGLRAKILTLGQIRFPWI
jgi:hypothetical protein